MPSRNELHSEYPIGNVAANRSRQNAVAVGIRKIFEEHLLNVSDLSMNVILRNVYVELPNSSGVERHVSEHYLSSVFSPYQGKGAMQKLVAALQELRCLLSKSEFPPVDAALKAGAIALLVQCLSFGSPDEQLLEAAQSLTNIAAAKSEETKALLLLIAHLGGEELRSVLLSQGALPPLARMMLPYKGSTVRTAAWALSNLIKESQCDAEWDKELTNEVARVVVYLSALSDVATSMLVKSDALQLLVQ
ncbi:hypothetical protein POTOM_061578 [Populus tomentosa]|uniref:ARM repeat superfamily protein n=1 Tax=Populus tomentosa TaxID=118781 RepID=A0A8X7XLZ5_POPTO|nr:hypothetical protein POTOM_061578 [Populus tomentosa]